MRMACLPSLQSQNKGKNTIRYDNKKFTAVLSKVQAGKFDRGKKFEYNDYQRAGRIDAEPMNK